MICAGYDGYSKERTIVLDLTNDGDFIGRAYAKVMPLYMSTHQFTLCTDWSSYPEGHKTNVHQQYQLLTPENVE